jgi:hypothetical protein
MVPLLTKMFFLGEGHGFSNSAEYTCLEPKEPNSTFKSLVAEKDSFQTKSQFSLGNNVLESAASDIDVFLRRGTCVSSTQLNCLFGTK